MLAVKENQGRLSEEVSDLFEGAEAWGFADVPADHAQTVEKNHGRLETRDGWAIEDAGALAYVREDESRVRKDHGPENLAVLRQVALNLLKRERSGKHSIKSKRLKAGWREDYLLKVLTA